MAECRRPLTVPEARAWCPHAQAALWGLVAPMLAGALASAPVKAAESATGEDVLEVLFSSRMFSEVHRGDAKAAVIAWAASLAKSRGLDLKPSAIVVDGVDAIKEQLRASSVDVVAVATDEFAALDLDPSPVEVFLTEVDGDVNEEYQIVVHAESEITGLEGLRGASIFALENHRTALLSYWLEVALLQSGLAPAERFFGKITPANKPTNVVLPVFFHQADACIVTKRSLAMIEEMNPQVGKNLRVLMSSPPLIPSVGFVDPRAAAENEYINLPDVIAHLSESPGGEQFLRLFQGDALRIVPLSALDPTLELLAMHGRMCPAELTHQSGSFAGGPQPVSQGASVGVGRPDRAAERRTAQ